VVLSLRCEGSDLVVQVQDDGAGLPPGFDLESAAGLGLSIVRTLITTELSGSIEMRNADGEGLRPGTRVTLRVPLAAERVTDPDDAGNLVRGSVPGLDRTRQGSGGLG
jgi:two-component sensor histidine kinase